MRKVVGYSVIALAALALLLAALYLPSDSKERSSQTSGAPHLSMLELAELAPEVVSSIQLTQGERSVSLRRQAGQWWIIQPFHARASDSRLEHLIQLMATIPVQEAKGVEWPKREKTEADFTVQVDGEKWRFAQEKNGKFLLDFKGVVYQAAALPLLSVELDPNDYLRTRLLPEGARLSEIRLPDFDLIKKDNGAWSARPSQNAASDELAALALQWKLAYALRAAYQPIDFNGKQNVSIYFENNQGMRSPLKLMLISQKPLQLYDPKNNISYYFAGDMANTLLHVQPQPIQGYSGDTIRLQ